MCIWGATACWNLRREWARHVFWSSKIFLERCSYLSACAVQMITDFRSHPLGARGHRWEPWWVQSHICSDFDNTSEHIQVEYQILGQAETRSYETPFHRLSHTNTHTIYDTFIRSQVRESTVNASSFICILNDVSLQQSISSGNAMQSHHLQE